MSRWGALEAAVLSHLKEGGDVNGTPVTGLVAACGVKTLANLASIEQTKDNAKSFPAVLVVWSGFDVAEAHRFVGTKLNPIGSARIAIQVWTMSGAGPAGAGRLKENGAYEILDQVRALLLGWVPTPPAGESQYPFLWQGEGLVEIDGPLTGYQAEYSITQAIRGS